MASSTARPPSLRVALLRGVNLGPNRRLAMADLRAVAEGLGWTDVGTHLQSGNLLFRSAAPDAEAVADLTTAVDRELAIRVDVVLRSGEALRGLLDANPFGRSDPARAVIVCCDRAVGELAPRRLAELQAGRERFEIAATGTDVYADFPDGQAASRLAAGLVGALRPATGTARNLRTMGKLAELLLA
ncbi:MAG: DUF1697 domain-containing protein [Propionicimonas sp.]|uniref:DUF1697 domain-containing protein n=1 Tax=Propionicimonas sp. TaxID=1955623 RepID=UPI003D0AE283